MERGGFVPVRGLGTRRYRVQQFDCARRLKSRRQDGKQMRLWMGVYRIPWRRGEEVVQRGRARGKEWGEAGGRERGREDSEERGRERKEIRGREKSEKERGEKRGKERGR